MDNAEILKKVKFNQNSIAFAKKRLETLQKEVDMLSKALSESYGAEGCFTLQNPEDLIAQKKEEMFQLNSLIIKCEMNISELAEESRKNNTEKE